MDKTIIKDVAFIIYTDDEETGRIPIADRISKGSLVRMLADGKAEKPEIRPGQELCLGYEEEDGSLACIDVLRITETGERYGFSLTHPVLLLSVATGQNLAAAYTQTVAQALSNRSNGHFGTEG